MNMIKVSKKCQFCGKENTVEMPEQAHRLWMGGEFIQRAWPQATAEEREAAVSGTHGACWDEVFGGDEWN